MKLQEEPDTDAEVYVNNIGGIQEADVQFSPGVSVLVGRNATNRTSLLRAIMAGLGSDDVSLKGDAEEGEVALSFGETTYTRRVIRQGDSVRINGDPYRDDTEVADLFAFLLETNEARRAVLRDGNLREVIMAPIDTDALQTEIDRLVARRKDLKREIDEIDDLKAELPGMEEKRGRLQSEIDDLTTELEAKEDELEAKDADIEDSRAEQEELEAELEALTAKRSTLDDLRYDLETERERLEALKRERQDLEERQAKLPEPSEQTVGDIDARIAQLRDQKNALESEVSELKSVIGFNEDLLTDAPGDLVSAVSAPDQDIVEEGLTADDKITCWTCGSEVNKSDIDSTIDTLRERSKAQTGEIAELEDEIESLTTRKRELESRREERNQIEERLQEIDSEQEAGDTAIEELQTKREKLTEEIEAVEKRVDEMENEDYSVVMELHKEANQLEYDLGRLEEEFDQVTERIASIEERLSDRDDIEERLAGITDDIEDLRTRIERIEEEAVEEFNTHMASVLDLLNYSNLDRIWIEQKTQSVREGRGTTEQNVFELHVIRTTSTGAAYEDTVSHLSESEREVTGLVFALAGYMAHEVYQEFPFMLLDSLEALDSTRIASIIDYFKDYSAYLVVALLPEDAQAVDDDYQRITEI